MKKQYIKVTKYDIHSNRTRTEVKMSVFIGHIQYVEDTSYDPVFKSTIHMINSMVCVVESYDEVMQMIDDATEDRSCGKALNG